MTIVDAGLEDRAALRRRLALVRGRPAWSLAVVGASIVVAVLCFSWSIGFGGYSEFYASSAVSMATDPFALLTGAMDKGATVTLDKLSGFLVPQALAVRLLGVHPWVLILPQVLEGVATLVGAYALAVRWRGPLVGALTALAVAFTPLLAALFGRPVEDALLTMATVLAVVAAQRAVLTGRVAWLLLAAAWVAVGFQAKMLQAWFIVPAVLVLWIVGSRGPLVRRLLVALGTGVATAALSLSWIVVISLLPDRPYADGTTSGSIFAMVFGYNGANRLMPGAIPDAVTPLGVGVQLPTRFADAQHSALKVVLPALTTQIGWLYPLALAATILLALALVPALRRRLPGPVRALVPETALERGMAAALVLWIAITALVLTPASVPHASYFAPIAVPIAILAAVAVVSAAAVLRERIPGSRWAVPVLALATAGWDAAIVAAGPSELHAVAPVVAVAGLVGSALVAVATARPGRRPLLAAGAILSLVAIGIGPVLWSVATIFPNGNGSTSDAYAGPRIASGSPERGGSGASHASRAARTLAAAATTSSGIPALRPPWEIPPDPALTSDQRHLIEVVRRGSPGTRVLFATDALAVAETVIVQTPYDAVPMAGFSRLARTPTLAQLQADLRAGTFRYVLLSDSPEPANPAVDPARRWVRDDCRAVLRGTFRAESPQRQTLFDCAPAVR